MSAAEAINHPWLEKYNLKYKTSNVSKERFNFFIENLKTYKADYKLQQAAIAIIVHNIPHSDEVKEIERAFRIIDENKDGKLTKQELINGFEKLFKDKTDIKANVEEIFKNVDADLNGFIEYEEFIRACIDKDKLLTDANLNFAFNFFDVDGSGSITLKELKQVFCGGGDIAISTNLIHQIINNIDSDGDGQINFAEFKVLMKGILTHK